MTQLQPAKIIRLPKVVDARGNLTFIEGHRHVPFEIGRVYFLYDVPGGGERGGHAHRNLEQVIVAVAGSFDVKLRDGKNETTISLKLPFEGLYVPRMLWRDLANFSSGSVCLVLASQAFDESDYIRDFAEFLRETSIQ